VATVPAFSTSYTLEQAEQDIANLRGLVDVQNEAQTILDGPVPNVAATSGVVLFSAGGNLNYEGFDGTEYDTGRQTMFGPATDLVISSATPVNLTGMSCTVNAGVYRINAKIGFTQGGGAFGQSFLLACPSLTFTAMAINFYLAGSGSSSGCSWSTNTSSPITITSPGFAAASTFFLDLDAIVSFSASGSFTGQAAEGTSGHSFTLLANSFVDLMPVS